MEQTMLHRENQSIAAKVNIDSDAASLSTSQVNLITEDLATFLITHYVLISGNKSVASIKEYFSRSPEIFDLVDDLLVQMEKSNLISVDGDKVLVKHSLIELGDNLETLRKFVPRLFRLSASRVLTSYETNTLKQQKEALRYFVMPNNFESNTEAQAIYLEFKSKMKNLVQKNIAQDRNGDGIRLVGVFNCLLQSEDFV